MKNTVPSPSVGARVRSLRKHKGMTVNGLAKASNVSAGMISQIERDRVNPSLRTLYKLGNALHVPLSMLIEDYLPPQELLDLEARCVRRLKGRPAFQVGGRLEKELLSPLGAEGMQFMTIQMPPHSKSEEVVVGPGLKAGLVIEGELCLVIDRHEIQLQEGDSFQFDSTLHHSIANKSNNVTRLLWIMAFSPVAHM